MLMPVRDCHSPAQDIPVTEILSQCPPSLNQQTYLRLRLALSLNLRRQILIAVCDDATLRQQLVTQLPIDLASEMRQNGNAPLVSLALDVENLDILSQLQAGTPNYQITDIDRFTRQPVHIQRSCLDALAAIARQLPELECNLVLWVTRPWCRAIQQSVPDFWRWHTGLFEFEGDPFGVHLAQPAPPTASNGYRTAATGSNGYRTAIGSNGHRTIKLDPELAEFVLTAVLQAIHLNDAYDLRDRDQAAIAEILKTNHPDTEPLQLLQQIEALCQESAAASAIAQAYRQLGDWYRDRIDAARPNSGELTIVIRAYEQALKLIDMKSAEVPDLLNDIANLYWIKARSGEGAVANLEKALKAYQFALDRTDSQLQPQTYAMIQNNLGSVYSDFAAVQAPEENLQHAITAYRASVEIRSFESDPARYAATQNNLGTAHWNLAQYRTPMPNLQAAISAYHEALRYYTPEREPMHYAMLQNNLGTTYWNLSRCDQAVQEVAMAEDFLHLAIGAYRVALIYRTLEAAPAAYAATQNNLGTAYWHLANQDSTHADDRATYILGAINAYQEALGAVQYLTAASTSHAPALSFDLSATHHHIGLAYYQMAIESRSSLEPEERLQCLQHALKHQVRAAQGWQNQPDFQPSALGQLGQILRGIYDRQGIQGQTQALSQIPAGFLPQVMREL